MYIPSHPMAPAASIHSPTGGFSPLSSSCFVLRTVFVSACLFLLETTRPVPRSRVPCTWAASTRIQAPGVRGPELSVQSAWKRSSASGCWVDESTFVSGPFRWRNVVMDGAIQERRNFAGRIVWSMGPRRRCTVTKICESTRGATWCDGNILSTYTSMDIEARGKRRERYHASTALHSVGTPSYPVQKPR